VEIEWSNRSVRLPQIGRERGFLSPYKFGIRGVGNGCIGIKVVIHEMDIIEIIGWGKGLVPLVFLQKKHAMVAGREKQNGSKKTKISKNQDPMQNMEWKGFGSLFDVRDVE